MDFKLNLSITIRLNIVDYGLRLIEKPLFINLILF